MAIEKLKRHKSPGIDQIPAELIKAGGRTICSEIHKLINLICHKKELPEEWKESITVPIYRKGDKRVVVIKEEYHICQLCTKFYPTSCCLG
jgi:CO dehydrogenase/acetyl-CoA synthase beta subunit